MSLPISFLVFLFHSIRKRSFLWCDFEIQKRTKKRRERERREERSKGSNFHGKSNENHGGEMKTGDRDPLGTLQKSCKYHTKRKRVGTTFAGQNLPGSPWHPAKVLQMPQKRKRVGTTFAGQNLPGSPWHPAKVLQIPHKTEKGRNNICGSKFAGIPLAPCKSPANTTQNGKG